MLDDDNYRILRDDEIFVNHLHSVHKMFAEENFDFPHSNHNMSTATRVSTLAHSENNSNSQ